MLMHVWNYDEIDAESNQLAKSQNKFDAAQINQLL